MRKLDNSTWLACAHDYDNITSNSDSGPKAKPLSSNLSGSSPPLISSYPSNSSFGSDSDNRESTSRLHLAVAVCRFALAADKEEKHDDKYESAISANREADQRRRDPRWAGVSSSSVSISVVCITALVASLLLAVCSFEFEHSGKSRPVVYISINFPFNSSTQKRRAKFHTKSAWEFETRPWIWPHAAPDTDWTNIWSKSRNNL